MNEITMAAVALLLVLVGASIGFLLGRMGRSNAKSKLEETRAEYDDYRKDVTRHFDQTAEQFHAIGQQYRDLYEHMAKGAEAFCVPTEPGSALPFSTQTRLPTDVEEAEAVIDETPELVAEELPKDEVIEETVDERPLDTEAAADEMPEEAVEAAEVGTEAAEAADEPELAADAVDRADEPTAEEGEPAVEPTPDSPKEDGERIYH